ncbi:GNAT family N-acetyltransferase [Nocardia grenadensis]
MGSVDTARLALRPFELQDSEELHEIFSDPQTHTIGDGPFTSLEQTRDWIDRRIEARLRSGLVWYAVRDRATGLLLGNCGVFTGRTGPDDPEIGYEIRQSWQGQGLAGEAARAVLDEALSSGIPRIWATIRPHNTASQRVATRIGLQHHSVGADSKGRLLYLVSPRQSHHPGDNLSRISAG